MGCILCLKDLFTSQLKCDKITLLLNTFLKLVSGTEKIVREAIRAQR